MAKSKRCVIDHTPLKYSLSFNFKITLQASGGDLGV